ncbi:MAG: hypothetical protein GTO41_27550 [Burkholderiales bacterium]|nr:hypothetical protein [Burkholderiales bacterium]
MPKNIISWKLVLTGTQSTPEAGRVEYCLGYAPDEPPENVRPHTLSQERMADLISNIGPQTNIGQLHGLIIARINAQEGI